MSPSNFFIPTVRTFCLFILLLVVSTLSFLYETQVEYSLQDWLLTLRGSISNTPASPQLIRICMKSTPDAWDRSVYAQIITSLNQQGAAPIAVDIIFQNSKNDSTDRLLIQAIRSSGNVYLPVVGDLGNTLPSFVQFSGQKTPGWIMRNLGRIPHCPNVSPLLHSFDQLNAAAGTHTGHINVITDADGNVRRIPLFIQHGQTIMPHLMLQMLIDIVKCDPAKIQINAANQIVLPNCSMPDGSKKTLRIPFDKQGYFRIYFPAESLDYPQIYYDELLKSNIHAPELFKTLKNKAILITDEWKTLNVPGQSNYQSGKLLQLIFNNFIHEDYVRELTAPLRYSVLLFVILISMLIIQYFDKQPVKRNFLLATTGLGYLLCTCLALLIFGLFLPMAAVLSLSITLFVVFSLDHIRHLHVSYKKAEETSFQARYVVTHNIKNELSGLLLYLRHAVPKAWKQHETYVKLEEMTQHIFVMTKRELLSDHAAELIIPVSILKRILDGLKPQLDKKNISIQMNMPDVKLRLPEKDFRDMVRPILENAITFSTDASSITISITRQPSEFNLNIQDNGPGFSEIDLQMIKNKGYSQRENGTGIGLYSARTLATKLQGRLRIESQPGLTTVSIILPGKYLVEV